MNITSDQRTGLTGIIEANGRGNEFYVKFGQPKVAKNKSKAEALVVKINANNKALELARDTHNQQERDLSNKGDETENELRDAQREEVNALERKQGKVMNALRTANQKANKALVSKNEKARDVLEGVNDPLEKQVEALGFKADRNRVNGEYVYTAIEDTYSTSAEYEMFKKRALAGIICAETLAGADKVIQNYLNLVK